MPIKIKSTAKTSEIIDALELTLRNYEFNSEDWNLFQAEQLERIASMIRSKFASNAFKPQEFKGSLSAEYVNLQPEPKSNEYINLQPEPLSNAYIPYPFKPQEVTDSMKNCMDALEKAIKRQETINLLIKRAEEKKNLGAEDDYPMIYVGDNIITVGMLLSLKDDK